MKGLEYRAPEPGLEQCLRLEEVCKKCNNRKCQGMERVPQGRESAGLAEVKGSARERGKPRASGVTHARGE